MGQWIGLNNIWREESVEECLKKWFEIKELKKLRIVPFLVILGIWIAHN